MEKPFAVFGVFFLAFVVWFVTTAGEFLAIAHIHAEAKLFRFGGLDVEECRLMSHDGSFFSVFYDYQMQAVSNIADLFLRIKHLCHFLEDADDLFVSVNCCLTFVLSLFHMLADHTNHPDNTHDVIHMFVCHEDLAHVHPVKSGMFELCQQSISTTAVNQQMLIPISQHKTCIVTLSYHRISSSQHCNIHKSVNLSFVSVNIFRIYLIISAKERKQHLPFPFVICL